MSIPFVLQTATPTTFGAWSHENEEVEGKIVITPGQICLPQGDALARELYERCLAIGHDSELREDWGPNLMSKVIPEMGLPPAMFGTPATFYPIDWISVVILAFPAAESMSNGSCAVLCSRLHINRSFNTAE
jgi:hypothetical protein